MTAPRAARGTHTVFTEFPSVTDGNGRPSGRSRTSPDIPRGLVWAGPPGGPS